jgi:hypothetical protein
MTRRPEIRVVAAMVIANAAVSGTPPLWEEYPDIGEHDWAEVLNEVHRQVDKIAPELDDYIAAYDALTARANADGRAEP